MSDRESRDHLAAEEVAHLLELTEIAVQAEDLEKLAQRVLSVLMRVTGATGAILCLEEPRPPFHSLFPEGIKTKTLPLDQENLPPSSSSKFRPTAVMPLPIIVPLSPRKSIPSGPVLSGSPNEAAGVFRISPAGA